jgi:DNA processing protein
MEKEKLAQAINWETILKLYNDDYEKACKVWDLYKHMFLFPISSDFSLWSVKLDVSINKLFETYSIIKDNFKDLLSETKILVYGDIYWPNQINDFPYPTRVLYCLGKVELLSKTNVSIIGTKSPAAKSVDKIDKVVDNLIKNEILVNSSLSFGIAGHAAVKSLSSFAPVIAVIPTSLDKYYPKEHKDIQSYIAKEGGVVVTRVAPRDKNIKWNILLRNRLMSALSSSLLILEEVDGGGAIQIADFALRNNRDVYFFSSLKSDSSISWPQKLINKGAKTLRFPSDLPKAINGIAPVKLNKKRESEEIVQMRLF